MPPLEGEFPTGFPPFAGVAGATAPIILQMHGVRFDQPGHYSFELLVDGHHLRSLPLHFVAGLEDERERRLRAVESAGVRLRLRRRRGESGRRRAGPSRSAPARCWSSAPNEGIRASTGPARTRATGSTRARSAARS